MGNSLPVLYRKDKVEIVRWKVLLVGNQDAMLRHLDSSYSNEQGAACLLVNSKGFEMPEAGMAQWLMCSEKLNVYWNDKECNRL